MSDRPTPPKTVQRINNQGLVEVVDIHTGRVLCIQPTPNDDYLHNRFENLVKIETPEGPVFIERHLDPARVLKKGSRQAHPQFSLAWAELVVAELLTPIISNHGGDPSLLKDPAHKPTPPRAPTLTQALKRLNLPPALFARWRQQSEPFAEIIDAGLQAQAQWLQDEALTTVREANPKQVGLAALQADTLMKQAKTADQARFGDKQKLDVTTKAVHTIVVETGIRRRSNPEELLPPGFEEALKDATPVSERKEGTPERSISGSSRDAQFQEEAGPQTSTPGSGEESYEPHVAQISHESATQAPAETVSTEKARASGDHDRDPWTTSKPSALPRFQDHQTPNRPLGRSLLETARGVDLNTESRPIPDLEDSEF